MDTEVVNFHLHIMEDFIALASGTQTMTMIPGVPMKLTMAKKCTTGHTVKSQNVQ